MPEADRVLGMYLHLARASKLRQQPLVRAKLLVLAGVQAEEMGLDDISALCRHRILSQNPRHLVRKWPTMHEALSAEPFQTHLKQLRRRYSQEKAEHMLQSLGIEMGQERAAYFSDAEYAAALLDTRVEAIGEILSQSAAREGSTLRQSPAESLVSPARKSPNVRDVLIVWAPFACGVLLLVALAIVLRNLQS
jgi:hypothetical protein